MKYYYHPNMTPPPPGPQGEQPPQNGGYTPPTGQYYPPTGQYYPPGGQYGQPPYPPYGYPPYGYPPYGRDPFQEQQEKAAKQPIRRDGNGIGWGVVLTQVFGVVLGLILPLVLDGILPTGVPGGQLFYEAIQYALYSPISILLPMWIGLKICKGNLEDVVPFGQPNWLLWVGCILSSFFFVFVGNLAGDVAGMLSPATVENLNKAMGAQAETPLELAVNILYVAAIPALVEEIAFRGIALGVLRRWGDKLAIVASALLFGLLHGNFVQIPFAYFMGLILGYTVVRTGSIVPAIIIHFINNAMSCVITYFTMNMAESSQTVVVLLMYGSWLVLGLLGLCVLKFCFPVKLMDCCKPYSGCLTPQKRSGALWASSGMIGAVVIHLFLAVVFATEGVM